MTIHKMDDLWRDPRKIKPRLDHFIVCLHTGAYHAIPYGVRSGRVMSNEIGNLYLSTGTKGEGIAIDKNWDMCKHCIRWCYLEEFLSLFVSMPSWLQSDLDKIIKEVKKTSKK